MKHIAIIGFGRFGKTLYRLLKDDFAITLFDQNTHAYDGVQLTKNTTIAQNIEGIYRSEVIFYAVPIAAFERVIASQKKFFRRHLLIDVLAVKQYPAQIFKKYLRGTEAQALLTHPLFGPDSSKDGFVGLPIVMDRCMADNRAFTFWKDYFSQKGLRVIERSSQEHDRFAANSQGITHFIGRLLEEFHFTKTPIDTLGAKKLHEVMDQTCNDTWDLFLDLQMYNPYTKHMRIQLGKAYDKLCNTFPPKPIDPRVFAYGIQGGRGSFNEEALLSYMKKKRIRDWNTKYLYTAEKVLRNLHDGNIDYGLFAIQNIVGGVVQESMRAMARYKFKIIDEFAIPVRHFLMKRKDVATKNITSIMAHPQALKQCKRTLAKKYSSLRLMSGKGDMIDTAKAASALAKAYLSSRIAILGSSRLATLYDFDIIDEHLEDDRKNETTFFLVRR